MIFTRTELERLLDWYRTVVRREEDTFADHDLAARLEGALADEWAQERAR